MILHQILIESKNFTYRIKELQLGCMQKCEEYLYDYFLWTNENISVIENDENYKDILEKAKSLFGYGTLYTDILRFCIIDKYGGVYLDCDYVIENDFSSLIENCYFAVSEFSKDTYINAFFYGKSDNIICKNILKMFLNTPEYFFNDKHCRHPVNTIFILMYIFTININMNKNIVKVLPDIYMSTNPSNYVEGKSFAKHLRVSTWRIRNHSQ